MWPIGYASSMRFGDESYRHWAPKDGSTKRKRKRSIGKHRYLLSQDEHGRSLLHSTHPPISTRLRNIKTVPFIRSSHDLLDTRSSQKSISLPHLPRESPELDS